MALLTPQDRTLLIESLRPPSGYQLDIALGTTYSLDLLSLMVAPVGFTFFELDREDPASLQADPLEVLEAIRRHASQIVIFHQAGRIAVPDRHRPLLTYLEDRIIATNSPTAGYAFHPKVWIIRYVNGAKEVAYRLLCLSRNLTFDRSWDTVLTLDGPLRDDRAKGFGFNDGLEDFIRALPELAVRKPPASIRAQIRAVENEISRVEWDLEGTPFESVRFWPLGHDSRMRWPFKGKVDRLLVVSPFVTPGTLERLHGANGTDVLVSRSESLDEVSTTVLDKFSTRYQMSVQGAILEPDGADGTELQGTEDAPFQGLHAKLFIADSGWNGRVWTGSANATSAAFGGNVEFLVELEGKRSVVGVNAFLERVPGTASFLDLLVPYEPSDVTESDQELEALKKRLDGLRQPIASAGWVVTVTAGEFEQQFVPIVSNRIKLPSWPGEVSVSCRPLSLNDAAAVALMAGSTASIPFTPVALETLTGFLVIQMTGKYSGGTHKMRFLVNADVSGAPPNRKDRILQHMLHDRKALMRFLLLLLADVADDPTLARVGQAAGAPGTGATNDPDASLLEPLLRTLARSPARLKVVRTLVDELSNSVEGAKLMPDGFLDLFNAVWSATDGVAP